MAEVKTFYFTEGNTVRQVAQPLPDRHEIERERRERQERNRKRQQRKRAAMMRRKRLYTVYIMGVIAVAGVLFVGYVNLTNSITTHMDNIAALESQVTDLKAENSAAQSRISTVSNLADVKSKALNELGMVYAKADQIVYYNMDDSDYMSQYHKIP